MAACLVTASLSADVPRNDPKMLYQYACAQCHGEDGTAKTLGGAKLPGRVLADRKWLEKQTEETLTRSILDGKGAMPSFKMNLTQEHVRRILAEVVRPMAKKTR